MPRNQIEIREKEEAGARPEITPFRNLCVSSARYGVLGGLLVVFILFGRQIVGGIMSGAVKG